MANMNPQIDNKHAIVGVDESNMSVAAVITTPTVDRMNDRVVLEGGDTSKYKANPVVLWDHGLEYSLPIAKSEHPDGRLAIRKSKRNWVGTAYFSQRSQMSEQVFGLIADGIIRATSIRFKPTEPPIQKSYGREFTAWELEEWSFCPIGVNPETVVGVIEKGRLCGAPICDSILRSLKAAVPNRKRQTAVRVGWEPMKKAISSKPLGAQVLIAAHSEIKCLGENIKAAVAAIENPAVKQALTELLAGLQRMSEAMEGGYSSEYKEQMPAYEGAPKEMDGQPQDGQSPDQPPAQPSMTDDERLKSFLRQSKLSQYRGLSIAGKLATIAELVDGEPAEMLESISRSISEMCKPDDTDDSAQREIAELQSKLSALQSQLKSAIPARRR